MNQAGTAPTTAAPTMLMNVSRLHRRLRTAVNARDDVALSEHVADSVEYSIRPFGARHPPRGATEEGWTSIVGGLPCAVFV